MTESMTKPRAASVSPKLSALGLLWGSCFVAALIWASQVHGHSGATGVVLQRMDLMKEIGAAMKVLSDQFKGTVPYDPPKVSAAAAAIGRHAGEQMTVLFPAGSDTGMTEAKAEIWQDWDDFETLAYALEAKSAALVETVAHSPQKTDSLVAFGELARTCSGCHTRFRAEQ